MTPRYILFCASLLLLAGPAASDTILIQADGSGDYPTIQEGLDNTQSNDVVLLGPGTYTGPGNRNLHLTFGVANVTITSQAGAASTIMDCQNASNWMSSFSSFTEDTTISGLTIRNADTAIEVPAGTDVFTITVEDCILENNTQGFSYSSGYPVTIRNNVFRDHNNGGNDGSALTIYSSTGALVENNVFESNSGGLGGAAFLPDGSIIRGNVFANNTASVHGGAFWGGNGSTIDHNTFVGNDAALGSGAFYASNATITHNIIAFSPNSAAMVCSGGTVSCNNVYGNAGGDALCQDDGDNISVDPGFCGVLGSGNFSLQSTSACTATNSPCGQLIGALDVGCGTVSVERSSWSLIKDIYRD
jgi:hypothetical protein